MSSPLPRPATQAVVDALREVLGATAELVRALNTRDLRPREHAALARLNRAVDSAKSAIGKAAQS